MHLIINHHMHTQFSSSLYFILYRVLKNTHIKGIFTHCVKFSKTKRLFHICTKLSNYSDHYNYRPDVLDMAFKKNITVHYQFKP